VSEAIRHVTIRGRVQGVGYRAWVEFTATSLGLEGWVRNRRDGSVEAVFAGPAGVVEQPARAGQRAGRARQRDRGRYGPAEAARRRRRFFGAADSLKPVTPVIDNNPILAYSPLVRFARGAVMRRLGSGAGCGVPRACLASTPREAGGHRPGPITRALPPFVGWTRTGKSGESPPEAVPEARSPRPKTPRWRARRRRGPSRDGPRPNHHNRACRRAAPLMSGGEICSYLGRHRRRENENPWLFDIQIGIELSTRLRQRFRHRHGFAEHLGEGLP
jgi:acylphosphatase